MPFDIRNKVAIITGGAGGIGQTIAEQLLTKGAKGVCIADLDESAGEAVVNTLKSKFGEKSAIFSKVDVTNYQQYEEAFKKTLEHFGAIDILFNNAGILNDGIWEKEIDINMKGVVNGIILGLDHYISKYKSGEEGVIINTSSIAGVTPHGTCPVYSGTKFGVLGLSLSFGDPAHYERSKVKLIAVCPGITNTPIFQYCENEHLGEPYRKLYTLNEILSVAQDPSKLVEGIIQVVENAENQTAWVIEDNQPPYEWILPERTSFAPKTK